MSLNEDTVTFGKYKDLSLSNMLRDRKYCFWLLKQDWFSKQYEYLYNKVLMYNPKTYFVLKPPYNRSLSVQENMNSVQSFLDNYEFFYLCPVNELKLNLSATEISCYTFYLEMLSLIKQKIEGNMSLETNPYDIKAPTGWLKKFEKTYALPRDMFKEFVSAYELPNIPSLIEDIKKLGGINYKGAQSFLIAKQKSLEQEKFWENILKKYYGQDIGVQFKYGKCIFDFIRIKTNTLYECKLGLKDFNEEQHKKYNSVLSLFSIIYLIGEDCIVDINKEIIYTTNVDNYISYFLEAKKSSKLIDIIKTFTIIEIDSLDEYFKVN